MEIAATTIATVTLLAGLVQWVTERLFGAWVSGERMVLVSGAVGIVACVVFQVDALHLLGLSSPYGALPGEILTGLVVGAGSNAVHDLLGGLGQPTTPDAQPHG